MNIKLLVHERNLCYSHNSSPKAAEMRGMRLSVQSMRRILVSESHFRPSNFSCARKVTMKTTCAWVYSRHCALSISTQPRRPLEVLSLDGMEEGDRVRRIRTLPPSAPLNGPNAI